MKLYSKYYFAILAATVTILVSCNKNSSIVDTAKPTVNTAAISKQIALDLYRSLKNGVGTTNGGLKKGNTGTLITMDSQTPCGSTVFTPTTKTTVRGDTTSTFVGRSTFMYMCDGYFNNNYTIDAYIQKDSLTTTETGTGFKNIYGITLYYNVKATDANYTKLAIEGYTTTSNYTSKLSGSTITESHFMRTGYTWTGINAQRTANTNPTFLNGKVDFDTHIEDVVGGTTTNSGYSGFMEFLPNNMMRSTIHILGGADKVYLINLITGTVTEV